MIDENEPVSRMSLEDLCTESQRNDLPYARNQRIYCEIVRRMDGSILSIAERLSRNCKGQWDAGLYKFLFADGRYGLLKGIREFNPSRGSARPYLTYNIRIEMLKTLATFAGYNETVRRKYGCIMRYCRQYFSTHGREPEPDEIMRATGCSIDIVMRIFWTYDMITDGETSDDTGHGHGDSLHAFDTQQSNRPLTWYDIMHGHPMLVRGLQHIVLLALRESGYSWREIVEFIVERDNPNWKDNHIAACLPSTASLDWSITVQIFDCLELWRNDTATNEVYLRALYSRMNRDIRDVLK